MGAPELSESQGFFSILGWRADPTRDEGRNLAVILVEPSGEARLRAAPLSSVSQRLREQGLLDAILVRLGERVDEVEEGFSLLSELHASLQNSLYLTSPRTVAVEHDPKTVLDGLYRAYCAPVQAPRRVTKGVLLDRVVKQLRDAGVAVKRGEYVGQFIFDAVIDSGQRPSVIEVLSFAGDRKDWIPIQHDAGYFIYALDRVELRGSAVVQPPTSPNAAVVYENVRGWLDDAKVKTLTADELRVEQDQLLEAFR
jgi:hypothetical protein